VVEKDFLYYRGVEVDGFALTKDQYKAEEGSTRITLYAAYLSTLAPGTHTLRVDFSDGEQATATFVIGTDDSSPGSASDGKPGSIGQGGSDAADNAVVGSVASSATDGQDGQDDLLATLAQGQWWWLVLLAVPVTLLIVLALRRKTRHDEDSEG
jgi:hypothetical protein